MGHSQVAATNNQNLLLIPVGAPLKPSFVSPACSWVSAKMNSPGAAVTGPSGRGAPETHPICGSGGKENCALEGRREYSPPRSNRAPVFSLDLNRWQPPRRLEAVTGTSLAAGTSEDSGLTGDGFQEDDKTNEGTTSSIYISATPEAFTADTNSTNLGEDTNQLEFILMVLIPLILLALLLLSVVLLAAYYKRKRTKKEPSSQGSQSALQTCELGGDNLKVPIFEEDTPSVMEIEMEELDKWMSSMNRNADCECLPTLKEEKESNHNPSDSES
ncbi:transmembrane protein 154 [Fukomys damarensis]|uniref:transmembrane protein 154 n=1 Tax=Fukomys damarensis TaxID=885580 RepID=UPI0014559D55|nr:transmembrane protein 154 [Fukomys damarensis]